MEGRGIDGGERRGQEGMRGSYKAADRLRASEKTVHR